ncbi:MAG: aminotransferase class I/II-fold pyridoxal phosphate-dependent enzyme [Bacteroidales bacterium]
MHERLKKIEQEGLYRTLRSNKQHSSYIALNSNSMMVNLSSNDYLGLASDEELLNEFYDQFNDNRAELRLSASSSRLLTGNFDIYQQCETTLASLYGAESALIFNSGYHANSGILPALAQSDDLILADKLVHASIIDGIRLSSAESVRYRHNDYAQLRRLISERGGKYKSIYIVTESIFSMDGDICDLQELVAIKREFPNVILYIDEAHAVGCCGKTGLGLCEQQGVMSEIDIIIGTFGKALAGVGAYAITNSVIRELMINSVRTLIFSTALPPVTLHWTHFILSRLASFEPQRLRLQEIIRRFKRDERFANNLSSSHIMPLMVGDSHKSLELSKELERKGFYALPVRPPTVPKGSARLRLSLRADLTDHAIEQLLETL